MSPCKAGHAGTCRATNRVYNACMTPSDLKRIRQKLGVTQEQLAQILGASFVSVNRWEGGHSVPLKAILDLYAAINVALTNGVAPAIIIQMSRQDRSLFLRDLFCIAYN